MNDEKGTGIEEFLQDIGTTLASSNVSGLIRLLGVALRDEQVDEVAESLSLVGEKLKNLLPADGSSREAGDLQTFANRFKKAEDVASAIVSLEEDLKGTSLEPANVQVLTTNLFHLLAAGLVHSQWPRLAAIFRLLGILRPAARQSGKNRSDGGGGQPLERVDFHRLVELLQSPEEVIRTDYLSEEASLEERKEGIGRFGRLVVSFFGRLGLGIEAQFVPASAKAKIPNELQNKANVNIEEHLASSRERAGMVRLRISKVEEVALGTDLILSLANDGSSGTDDASDELGSHWGVLRSWGSWSADRGSEVERQIDNWTFILKPRVKLRGEATVGPDGIKPISGSSGESFGLTLEVKQDLDESPEDGDGGSGVVIGDEEGTHLKIGRLAGLLRGDWNSGKTDWGLEASAGKGAEAPPSEFVFDPTEADSFLSSVLPNAKLNGTFALGIGWDSKRGVYVLGGGGLEAQHSLDLSVGEVMSLHALTVGMRPGASDTDLPIFVGLSPKISLGPITARAEEVGLQANFDFPENQRGNFGLFDLEFGFKPPSGLGLSIDAGPITGGGFLAFYPDENRYSGTFELQIANLGVSIVGLLKTELPQDDGYSLLLLITGGFPPLQLGFGFMLTGMGGLGGLNRGFEKKALGKVIRSGNVNSVLFPENVVANADQIITDLRSIFPARADRHLFGPMLEVEWGKPAMLTMQVGVLITMPTWKIVLVGNMQLALPDDEVGLVVLNVAVSGVLDLPNEELRVNLSLYDSRVVRWALSGDAAMRLRYGDNAQFVMSFGGFHPRYTPPSDFPSLQRMKAFLAPPGGALSIQYKGYISVTPNTFQVGASVTMDASAGGASAHGHLSFDALFKFNPFKFVVDFHATLKVQVKGRGLSLSVDGTFSGPQPFRVKAKISIDLFLFEATVHLNAQIGPTPDGEEALPRATVLPKLANELERPVNWEAQQPDEQSRFVTLRDPNANGEGDAPEDEEVLAHPLGTLGVRQQVVPLEMRIEKFGNARPVHSYFEVPSFKVGQENGASAETGKQLREEFAPAKYRKMSDDEKLQAEAFEKMPAGRRLEDDRVHVAKGKEAQEDGTSGNAPSLDREATLSFETCVIDEEQTRDQGETQQPAAIGQELRKTSRVATAGTRTTGTARYRTARNPKGGSTKDLSLSAERYVIVSKESMKRPSNVENNPEDGQRRVEAVDALNAHLEQNPEDEGKFQIVGEGEVVSADGQ